MVESPPHERRQHTRVHGSLLVCGLVATFAWGCSGLSGPPAAHPDQALEEEVMRLEEALAALPAEPGGVLVVRLVFGPRADLDLFVSDPRSETVYFANRRARSGGRLAADVRCDAPAPRVETVRFEQPLPGRYRIGVDYPEVCPETRGGEPKPAVFVVEWRAGDAAGLAHGRVEPLVFDSIALEFELPGAVSP